LGKEPAQNQYTGACPYRKTAYTFAGRAPYHDQLELNQLKLMNVIDFKCVQSGIADKFTQSA
jgi:hypothetical protein